MAAPALWPAPAALAEEPSVQDILRNADLLVACEKGNLKEVKRLLGEGVSPNATRSSGASALAYAVAGRHTEVVRVLLEAKADPDRTSFGMTPLFLAAENGDLETTEVLLKAGADVNARLRAVDKEMEVRNGDTALMAAASPKVSPAVARALIKAGADVNARADNGKTAVMQAVAAENVEVLKVLLEAKADTSAKMEAPEEIDALTLAVGESRPDMVRMLIAAGADPNVLIDGVVSLLEFAILSDQKDIAEQLRKAGVAEPSAERIEQLRQAAAEP